jgi:demethylmenaquinone methyltransferase/2-methoxy-6-polyprenyl-1,4-benzoquinol methylase
MTFNSAAEKRRYVNAMFARIARRYDLMNRMMTGGQDVRWRQWMVRAAALPPGGRFLDVATGTGDVAFEVLCQQSSSALLETAGQALVVGVDFTLPMLRVGQARAAGRPVHWTAGDTLCLPFPDDTFDAVASGFLMRNVTDPAAALAEQRRVARPGGRVLVLDVPRPPDNLFGRLFHLYFYQVVPRLGRLVSGQPDAYTYLPRSADAFLRPDELVAVMESVGLRDVHYQMLMLGTVALHIGTKEIGGSGTRNQAYLPIPAS